MRATLALPLLAVAATVARPAQAGPPAQAVAAAGTAQPPSSATAGPRVRVAQAGPTAVPALPDATFPTASPPGSGPGAVLPEPIAGNSISLQAALMGTITSNPDLVSLRNSNVASAEAVEVARRFPTALNPTIWVDIRPINLIPPDTFVSSSTTGNRATQPHHGYWHGIIDGRFEHLLCPLPSPVWQVTVDR